MINKLPSLDFLLPYKKTIADQLRVIETKRAQGDPAKLLELANASDDELIVKWLWLVSIVGVPSCFLVAPFVLSLLGPFFWPPLRTFLWVTLEIAMILVFTIFLLAAYLTTRSKDA